MKRVLIALTLSALSAAAAANESAGGVDVEALVTTCAACHGAGGTSPVAPNYPVIGGQYQNFLVHALKAYRDGGRKNPIMTGQAQALSDAQIEALAHYFASQDGPLYTPTTAGHQ